MLNIHEEVSAEFLRLLDYIETNKKYLDIQQTMKLQTLVITANYIEKCYLESGEIPDLAYAKKQLLKIIDVNN